MAKGDGGKTPQDDAGKEGGAAAASEERLGKMEGSIGQLLTGMGQLVKRMDAGLIDPKLMEKIVGEVGKGTAPAKGNANPLAGVDFKDMEMSEFANIISSAFDEKLAATTASNKAEFADGIAAIRQDIAKMNIKSFKKDNTGDLDDKTMASVVRIMTDEPGISMESALKLAKFPGLNDKVQARDKETADEKSRKEALSDHSNMPTISDESFEKVKKGETTHRDALKEQATQVLELVDG